MKKQSLLFSLSVLVAMFFVEGVQAFSAGPPAADRFTAVCEQMLPAGHGTLEQAQPGSGGFLIDTDLTLISAESGYNYTAGQTYTVTLTGTMNTFRGFLVIAHVPGQDNMLLGQFMPQNSQQQNVPCDSIGANDMASIAHRNPSSENFMSQTFMWQAPDEADGLVNFRYTVVQVFSTYFVRQNAAENGPPPPPQPPTLPERSPEEYRLIFRTPPDCNLTNCTTYVGIDVNVGNNGYLDIYMEGEAFGWVAVGFTPTRDMFSADVVGCIRDPMVTDMVDALDTYNVAAPNRNNLLDQTQNIVLHNGSFDETRITCTVSKLIAPTDPAPEDLDLNTNLFVLWGVSNNSRPSTVGLANHLPEFIPAASNAFINPSTAVMVSVPVRNPLDYRLIFRHPSGCDPSQCRIFVGIDTNIGNSSFLDIYMEGEAGGWIAVGFSDTRSMFAADVVGCNRDSETDMVEAVDTWNPNIRGNVLDNTQNVVRFQSAFTNNRINCTVAKQISASGTGEDLDLNTGLFVMFGVRSDDAPGFGSLRVHVTGPGGNPWVSSERWNPADDRGEGAVFPIGGLLRAHGIIMLIAWPLLAVSGIFFAAWMRPALPNGEWFQIHRAFLLASMFVGAIGFVLAFVAHAQYPTPGLINLEPSNPVGIAHYVIGIIVMFMHILNPLISACRCHPGDKHRWIFNLLHGSLIGLLAEVLALINISLGLSRFSALSIFRDLTIFWVFIGYLIFVVAVIGILFLIFTLLSVFSNDDDRQKTAPSLIKPLIGSGADKGQKKAPVDEGVELAVPGQKPSAPTDAPAKPKVPSKDSPLRWGALTIFLAVNVVMMLILLILIAIE